MVSEKLHVLTLTTLYPNSVRPRHGVFVQTRLRKLVQFCPVEAKVIAPVPLFVSTHPWFGRYGEFAAIPAVEQLHDITVDHPRFTVIPKVGMALQPRSLASTAETAIRRIRQEGWRIDVVDAHYLYPDGVAAARVSERLALPFVLTARGSDVNVIAKMRRPRKMILDACMCASRVIVVSAALKGELIALGLPGDRIEVLRNGVDPSVFKPRDREATRQALGVGHRHLILSVGNMVKEKGHDLVLAAAARVGNATVVLVGDGPEKRRLEATARELGITERVIVLGNMDQEKLAAVYSAADVLALGSEVEGWPNVVLEAIACGTPVVATAVGGVPEIIVEPCAGAIVQRREVDSFAAALAAVLARPRAPERLRDYATRFDWKTIVERQYRVLATAARRQLALS